MGKSTNESSELEKLANVRDFTEDVLSRRNIARAQETSLLCNITRLSKPYMHCM
jgi:hypothetical protein